MNEIARIKEAYENRDIVGKNELYSLLKLDSLYIKQQREKAITSLLVSNNVNNLADKTILDVGCGNGGTLREFIEYGAQPENCFGLDLLPDRIENAKKLSPNINFKCGNAESLPYSNESFDILILFTVLTSVLDIEMKRNLANEMLRVMNPKSFIIYYDFHVNNPKNPDVRGVKKKEIQKLFPNCKISLRRVTLAPPLVRSIAPVSFIACQLLEIIPLLRTHYLGIIKKNN